jgi:hypothetical protein
MRLLCLFCVLLLTACPGDWRRRDTIREHGLIAITLVDWYQTVDITKNCNESNPIIGKCGERVNMHLYFATVLVLQGIVGRLISPDWRTFLHGTWIGVEGATVWDNAN